MPRSWLRLFWAGVLICGAIVGYLAISGVGARLLHEEIETQLSRLLNGPVEIAEVDLRFENGLCIEAHGLEAYPNPDGDVPALRASRVLAWVDLLAILVGRLELSSLILEGPLVRIEQRSDGSLIGLPLAPFAAPTHSKEGTDKTSIGELIAAQLESLDPTATQFLNEFRPADRIEVLDGAISWIDHRQLGPNDLPRELRLELVSGLAIRNWLSGEVTLDWRGVFVDGQHTPFPFEMSVHRDDEAHFEWKASMLQIPLETARTPLYFIRNSDRLTGTLDARFALTTTASGQLQLTFEATIEDAAFRLRESGSRVQPGKVDARVVLEFDSSRLRLKTGRFAGNRLEIEFKGAIDRPIRPRSMTRIESRMLGVQISGVRELARRYDTEFDIALAIARLTESVRDGQIRYIEAAGTTTLMRWLDLASGRSRELPENFTFGGGIDAVVLETGPGENIDELTGEIDWTEDRVSLRNMTGRFRGRPLPKMNAVFEGVSHLLDNIAAIETVKTSPPPIPGVGPLLQIFRPDDPTAIPTIRAIALAFDHLEHPLFRYPISDLRILIEPLRRGLQMNIREGQWAHTGIEGDIVWFSDPDAPTIDARITLHQPALDENPPQAAESEQVEIEEAQAVVEKLRWGSGRFEVKFRPKPTLPFETATGFFRLDDAALIGHEIEIRLAPRGTSALRAKIDLEDPESIGLDISFAITDATLEAMSEFVALPPGLVTGEFRATGSLIGRVQPQTSFIADLTGDVRIEAENGLVHTNLPLMLRLGKATEGFSPFADADELQYESMSGNLEIQKGWLRTEDFELEGPLRVYSKVRLNTNKSPGRIKAVVGIFLFRTPNEILSSLPLLKSFLPGSDRGLVGAYFKVKGPVDDPDVEALALKTMLSSVPNAIKVPFKAMRFLFGASDDDS